MRTGVEIRLGREFGRGGEGVIFAIEGQGDKVAKVYLSPPSLQKINKVTAMAEAASPSLLSIAGWPTDLLQDKRGLVRGLVMPRVVSRRDIHELYSPKSRREAFPNADFKFLSHVAANIARAFVVVHSHGYVIGDVNHGNLLVGPDGTVALIDCDSFQFGANSHVFTCDVGVPLFTPPELQGRSLGGVIRSQNHDLFGLAVLLFHLLFMGRHPFAGRYAGPGDMPIEQAIAEYRFAYGPDAATQGMRPPPATISLASMGSSVAGHFVRAFGRVGSAHGRPTGRDWIAALEALKASLDSCSRVASHHYLNVLSACPWCKVEEQAGIRLFGQRIIGLTQSGAVDVRELWGAIASVPDPGVDPVLPCYRPWQPPSGVSLPNVRTNKTRRAVCIWLVVGALVVALARPGNDSLRWLLVFCAAAFFLWPKVSKSKREATELAWSTAHAEWRRLIERWNREGSREVFQNQLNALELAKTELVDLPNERHRRFQKLHAERMVQQRNRYLDRFRIDRARIRGIGPGRTSMLESFGIETAADVAYGKIIEIPGFGESLTNELLEWRSQHERNFTFNPHAPVDRRDIDALDRQIEARRQALLEKLREGPNQLRRAGLEITAARSRLLPIMEEAWGKYQLAKRRRDAL